ncbi:MAG: ligase-associated DNA damage response endonuclease PdeM [Thermoflavifilum sp.]|nr:ligase-associated DNA damage response endonuclease PdeM [Thermoflavifilum sp.]
MAVVSHTSTPGLRLVCCEQTLHLLPEKAIYWEERAALLLADLHLGKAAHFRKAGIAVPAETNLEDLRRLQSLIVRYAPREIIMLGDWFHSEINTSIHEIRLWQRQFRNLDFYLIKGNHDVLPQEQYAALDIQVKPAWSLPPFYLVHDYQDAHTVLPEVNRGLYILSGHVHPYIRMKGKARQAYAFPCFYFAAGYAILPAFGMFTGRYMVHLQPGDQVFAILPHAVVPITKGLKILRNVNRSR